MQGPTALGRFLLLSQATSGTCMGIGQPELKLVCIQDPAVAAHPLSCPYQERDRLLLVLTWSRGLGPILCPLLSSSPTPGAGTAPARPSDPSCPPLQLGFTLRLALPGPRAHPGLAVSASPRRSQPACHCHPAC